MKKIILSLSIIPLVGMTAYSQNIGASKGNFSSLNVSGNTASVFDSIRTKRIKVGSSITIDGFPTGPLNAIYTDPTGDPTLYIQSQSSPSDFNTIINAGNTGNVGIGTTTPGAKLEVTATGGSHGIITSSVGGNGILATVMNGGNAVVGTANNGAGGVFSSTLGFGLLVPIGNVGIGTTTPYKKLTVNGDVSLANYCANCTSPPSNLGDGFTALEVLGNDQVPTRRGISVDNDPNGDLNFYIHTFQNPAGFNFKDGNTNNPNPELMKIHYDFGQAHAKVQIGKKTQDPPATHNDYMLSVDGKIVARKIVATEIDWADDELIKNITLDSLQSEESFVNQFGYLQGIPSGKEIEINGIDFGNMSSLQMRKIERLYKYSFLFNRTINKIQEENITLKNENLNLKNNNIKMQKEIDDIKNKLSAVEEKIEK